MNYLVARTSPIALLIALILAIEPVSVSSLPRVSPSCPGKTSTRSPGLLLPASLSALIARAGWRRSAVAPANDNCATPMEIVMTPWGPNEFSIMQDTTEATTAADDPETPCYCWWGERYYWRDRTMWFQFIAPAEGTFSIRNRSLYRSKIRIFLDGSSSCPGAAAEGICRVPYCSSGFYEFRTQRGQRVVILVAAEPGSPGGTLFIDGGWTSFPIDRLVVGLGEGDVERPAYAEVYGHAPELGTGHTYVVPWARATERHLAVHPAVGDVDGDSLGDIVAGLSSGGEGRLYVGETGTYIQVPWPAYNASHGETYPAVGNIDNDPAAEIVVGLGAAGGGFFYIFDDASTGFAPFGPQQGWYRIPWPYYNASAEGSVRPAIGDTDGDGIGEIILGLGPGSGGYVAVMNGVDVSLRTWVRVWWPGYNAANGETYPAAGDLDGDGTAEIAIGLGAGGQGYVELKGNALQQFWDIGWVNLGWDSYGADIGETRPALGNLDGDARAELVIATTRYGDPDIAWVRALDDLNTGFAHIRWLQAGRGWKPFAAIGVMK